MKQITVDISSAIPVYEQIRAQVAAAIAIGALTQGDRLPSARDLAQDLGIAVGTVQRAFKELEATGIVESKRRTGTTVIAAPKYLSGKNTDTRIVDIARELVTNARKAGFTDDGIINILRGVLRE